MTGPLNSIYDHQKEHESMAFNGLMVDVKRIPTLAKRPSAALFGSGKAQISTSAYNIDCSSNGVEWYSRGSSALLSDRPSADLFGKGEWIVSGVDSYLSDGSVWQESVKVQLEQKPYVVNLVGDLASVPSTIKTAFVKDAESGGMFNWSATGTVNNAITYAGSNGYWIRANIDNINLKYFLTNTTGTVDQAAVFTVARDLAISLKKPLYCPPGITIAIGSTIDMSGLEFIGSGGARQTSSARKTIIKSLITNGEPVFKLDGASFYSLQNFQILGSTSSNNPTGNAVNCIGIQVGDPDYTGAVASKACTNGILDAIDIYGCATGLRTMGWSSAWGSIAIRWCVLGAYLDRFNSGTIQSLRILNCNQYFKIRNTSGCSIGVLACEGYFETASSTINGSITDAAGGTELCAGIHIGHLRYENSAASGTVSFLDVGFEGVVSGFNVSSGVLTGIAPDVDVIRLDNVNGYRIDAYINNISKRGGIYSTSKARRSQEIPSLASGYAMVHSSELDVPARNVFPNGKMNGRGFFVSSVGKSNASLSDETVLYRSGYMATKIVGTNGASSGRMRLELINANFIESIKRNSITVAAWIYVPDIIEFDRTQPSKLSPQITVNTLLGATSVSQSLNGATVSTSATNVGWFRKGGWNFAFLEIDLINQVFDTLRIGFWISNDAVLMTNNAYIVVDEVFVCPGKVANKIYSGAVENSSALCTYNGLSKTLYLPSGDSSALKSIADNSWIVGDRIEYTDPDASGFIGEVCTVAGVAGAATWKTFSAISA